ncbi:MAG: hypothetical protein LWX83_02545 [Anaerolineae bacterium]|nr:hypothetical protein [Anaerolineae bacterium]
MEIAVCNSYHARLFKQILIQHPDGKSAFKVYYLSIIGRSQPQRYEWEYSPLPAQDFENNFVNKAFEGIGFVTAFPHITKVFRFSPQKETILDVQVLSTLDLTPFSEADSGAWHEFACYAEASLASQEYQFWAGAKSVPEYLAMFSSRDDFEVLQPDKLRRYWQS